MPDREKVIKGLEICTSRPCYCTDCPYKKDCALDSQELMEDALELLKEQGVKHGEWISIWREDDPDTSTDARCSVCNRVSKRPAGEYCKWCGAKMDLEGR